MNIKGKILNLPGYCVFTQNEAGRCGNRDIGKAKSQTDGTNLRKIISQNFPKFLGNPTRLGRLGAREDQRVTGTRRSSSLATAHRRFKLTPPASSSCLIDPNEPSWTSKGPSEGTQTEARSLGRRHRLQFSASFERPLNMLQNISFSP